MGDEAADPSAPKPKARETTSKGAQAGGKSSKNKPQPNSEAPAPPADEPAPLQDPGEKLTTDSSATAELVWLDPNDLNTPYAKALRPATEVEDADLKASINERGILNALTVTRKRRRVLDGHRRRQQAVDRKISKVSCVLVDDMDDEEEWAQAVILNADRRHLTPAEKRDLIDELLRRDPEASNRKIAKQLKVHHETVGAHRKELESTGEIRHFEKHKGEDGKIRPSTQNKQRVSSKPTAVPPADAPSGGDESRVASTPDTKAEEAGAVSQQPRAQEANQPVPREKTKPAPAKPSLKTAVLDADKHLVEFRLAVTSIVTFLGTERVRKAERVSISKLANDLDDLAQKLRDALTPPEVGKGSPG